MVRTAIAMLALVLAPCLLQADDDKKIDDDKKVEKAPAPKKVDDEAAPAPRRVERIVVPYYQREDRYARWQLYAVGQSNQWIPRVAYTPYGSYYLFNGAPFPSLPVRQREFMPVSLGATYRAAPAYMPYCE